MYCNSKLPQIWLMCISNTFTGKKYEHSLRIENYFIRNENYVFRKDIINWTAGYDINFGWHWINFYCHSYTSSYQNRLSNRAYFKLNSDFCRLFIMKCNRLHWLRWVEAYIHLSLCTHRAYWRLKQETMEHGTEVDTSKRRQLVYICRNFRPSRGDTKRDCVW